jgi:hypothetical protein
MKFHTQIARSFCQIGNKAPESGMWSNDMWIYTSCKNGKNFSSRTMV